jgi:hypothetical protein
MMKNDEEFHQILDSRVSSEIQEAMSEFLSKVLPQDSQKDVALVLIGTTAAMFTVMGEQEMAVNLLPRLMEEFGKLQKGDDTAFQRMS